MDIHQLNIESALFLRRLRMFTEQKPVEINEQTTELFGDIIQSIDKLMGGGDIAAKDRMDNLDFLFNLDREQFDLRQYFMCRLCIEQIGVTEDDLEAHIRKNTHIQKVKDQMESDSTAEHCKNEVQENDLVPNDLKESTSVFGAHKTDFDVESNSLIEVDRQLIHKSSFLVHVKGIPWTATKLHILSFFANLNILNGVNGIHFTADGSNDAYIQLASYEDFQLAMKKKTRCISNSVIRIMKANVDDFMNLVNRPNYPSVQRVLRLKELPLDCTESQSISKVHLLCNEANQFFGEAFVIFASAGHAEQALSNMFGRKIKNRFIKVFRSSEDQMQKYVDSTPYLTDKNAHHAIAPHRLYEVMARGFPWNVRRPDVGAFFANIKILGGNEGIHITKNGAMEAKFFVDSFEEMQKALARHNQTAGTRMIRGTFKIIPGTQQFIDDIDFKEGHLTLPQSQLDILKI